MAARSTTKGEATREAILAHALGLATRIGFEGLTIGRLAEALQMSKSGLFAHFRSKEGLQLEILRFAGARMVETVVKPAFAVERGEPRVRALFDRWLAWEQSPDLPGGCPFMAASFELDDRPGPVRDFVVQNLRDWIDTLGIPFVPIGPELRGTGKAGPTAARPSPEQLRQMGTSGHVRHSR